MKPGDKVKKKPSAKASARADAMNDMADEGLKRLTGMKPGDKVKKKPSARADAMSDMADEGLKRLTGMKPGDKVKKKPSARADAMSDMADEGLKRLTGMKPGDKIKKRKKKGFSEEFIAEKCWPGYEKKGMKTMFGKRYPNCVKKKTRKEEVELEEAAFKKQYGKKGKLSQSSKRKSLGRSSTVNPDAKSTGYESPAEFRAAEKRLSPYKEEGMAG